MARDGSESSPAEFGRGGSRRSRSCSSTFFCATARTSARFSRRTMSAAASVRSRTIDSTSRPTYPTSVNLLASTFRNGLPESRASRRAISVFPTPVGPIMRMFLGVTSAAISAGRRWRRMRLRMATATARLARACPTT